MDCVGKAPRCYHGATPAPMSPNAMPDGAPPLTLRLRTEALYGGRTSTRTLHVAASASLPNAWSKRPCALPGSHSGQRLRTGRVGTTSLVRSRCMNKRSPRKDQGKSFIANTKPPVGRQRSSKHMLSLRASRGTNSSLGEHGISPDLAYPRIGAVLGPPPHALACPPCHARPCYAYTYRRTLAPAPR